MILILEVVNLDVSHSAVRFAPVDVRLPARNPIAAVKHHQPKSKC